MTEKIETTKFEIEISIKEKPTTKRATKIASVKPLNDYSWAEILEICQKGDYKKYFRIGDKKDVVLSDGQVITFAIADFDHDVDKNDKVIPITFTAVNPLEEDCTMNDMAEFLTTLYESRIPAELKQAITFAKKDESVEPFFLHSEVEIFGRTIFSKDCTSKQYPYYAEKCHRCKFKNGSEWTATWWERSASYGNTNLFCSVDTYGGANGNGANYSLAVAPAFGIG